MKNGTSGISRRSFLATTFAGLVSASLWSVSRGKGYPPGKREEERGAGDKIIHRTLGRTGLKIPIVSMGVMNSDNPGVVRASYEIGVRHFDTAAYYQRGRNEEMVGGVVRELKARDRVVIGTKIFDPSKREGLNAAEKKKRVVRLCEESLKRLKMDYVDILYIHNVKDAEIVSDESVMSAMELLKKQGKARFLGVSTHRNMHAIINEAARTGLYDAVLTVVNFTLTDYVQLFEAIEKAAAKGLGIIAMKTQAGSARGSSLDIGDDYGSSTIARASLKWVLKLENITTAIPGYTTYEHMREDFSVAYGLEYTDQEKELLSDNKVKVGMGFCRQCGLCRSTCPRKVDIAALMRTHMYAARYGNFCQARSVLNEIPAGGGLGECISCGSCTAKCIRFIDVATRIQELKQIYA